MRQVTQYDDAHQFATMPTKTNNHYCEFCGRAKGINPYTTKRICKNLACSKPLK